ncbi:MAG: cardiolipin synthase [Sedimenticolaceae bacterium]
MDEIEWLIGAYVAIEIVGLTMAGRAVMTARTSQGAIAWAISLVGFPLLALPMYLVFGRRKFERNIRARRAVVGAIEPVLADLEQRASPYEEASSEFNQGYLLPLARLAKFPFVGGNDARLLVDGAVTFAALFDAIDAATDYVLVQYYILRDDGIGRDLQRRLLERLEQGISVLLLYDGVGSGSLQEYLAELTDAGAQVAEFGVSGRWSRRLQLNFRNHRKIVVVDGKVGFLGGLNVGDEYMGRHPTLTPWRDTHVEITGPAVIKLQISFVEDWYDSTGELPDLAWQPARLQEADRRVLILPSGPADTLETCGLFFTHLISQARKRVWIVSPYFVPDEAIVSALQLAALRGVDVRILLPRRSDNWLVHLAGHAYLQEIGSTGVSVYRYQKGFLHQKVVLVDDDTATVGTPNFDNRSFRLNFEVTAVFADREFNRQVAAMLENDFSHSERVDTAAKPDDRPLHFQLATRLARLFAPVL